MGHLQLLVPVLSLCGWARRRRSEDEWICPDAILWLHDMLPSTAASQWPLCAQVQAGSAAVCAAETYHGSHDSGAVHTRQIH